MLVVTQGLLEAAARPDPSTSPEILTSALSSVEPPEAPAEPEQGPREDECPPSTSSVSPGITPPDTDTEATDLPPESGK